jgi:hypothetical protein
LHPVELLEPEGVGEIRDRIGDLHSDTPAGGLIGLSRVPSEERGFLLVGAKSEGGSYPIW